MTTQDAREAAEILSQHQVWSRGMTGKTPDTCECGARIMPAAGDEDITDRRNAAFAQHQADALLAAIPTPAQVVALRKVRELADEWERKAGPDSEAWRVYGPQNVSVPYAVKAIRAALGGRDA